MGDLYRAVVRRWRLLIPSLALTFALAALYIFLTPARYAATLSLLVDTRERPPIGVDAQPIPQNADVALVEAQMRLLTSNEVLLRTVEDERLRFDPEFAPVKPSGVMAIVKSMFGGGAPSTEVMSDQIAETLAKAITTKRSEKSYVIDVEVRASSAEKAERLARALAKAYFETQSKLSDDIFEKESVWLDKKIADLRMRFEEAERRVEDFRKSKSIVVSDGRTLPEQQLKDANTALVAARGKLAEQEAKYAQLQAAARGGGSVESLNETIHAPLIEKLRGDYATLSRDAAYAQSTLGPRHPSYVFVQAQLSALRSQIAQEMRRIASAQRHDLEAARNAEKAAERLVADLQNSMDHFSAPRIELAELERQAAAVRDRYEKALAARENLHKEVVSSPHGVLIDQPTAMRGRVSPKTMPALIIAAAAGLNIWIASALTSEFFARNRAAAPSPVKGPAPRENDETPPDARAPRRRTPRGSSRFVTAPAAASVVIPLPAFKPEQRLSRGRFQVGKDGDDAMRARAHEIMEKPGDPYRGATGKVYDALWERSSSHSGALVVALAAEEEGAGVSTAALSLALFACAQGDRVLLLDGDARHSAFASSLRGLPAAKQDFGFDDLPRVYRRDPDGSGEIMLALTDDSPSGWPAECKFRGGLDLIVVDWGDGAFAAPIAEADVVIIIRLDSSGRARDASLYFAEEEDRDSRSAPRRPTAEARSRA